MKTKIKSVTLMAMLVFAGLINITINSVLDNRSQTNQLETKISSENASKDVLIINDPYKYAFFGWHRPTQFSFMIWEFLNNTVLWASNNLLPNETKIIFFRESNNTYATEVYDWLINAGYMIENIILHSTIDIETLSSSYYDSTDLVIYWDTYGYDPINIINSGVSFITVSVMHTDEMGIGNGLLTKSGSNDTFYISNNDYYLTNSYSLGPIIFEDSFSFQATEALADGKTLIKAEIESVGTQVEMSMIQNISILPGFNGNANMNFLITIPDSPLADILRESFFENTSAIEKNVEYDIPDNITLRSKVNLEKNIKDVSLQGDVYNGDGKVDGDDINFIASKLGYKLGELGFNPDLDLNWDGKIDMKDIAIAAHNYGKTVNNTGSLFVTGYYNGLSVNCTNVFYRGPEGSQKINISDSGYIWYNVLPGSYVVSGLYNGVEKSTNVVVTPEKIVYAQLDFGGTSPPSIQSNYAPVKEAFYQGISMEQILLLGFDININQSKILPWSTNNETKISMVANSINLAEPTNSTNWRIVIGPQDENATVQVAGFIFTKIEYMMLLLQSLAGEQVYIFNWQMGIDLPNGATLLNEVELNGLNWTIDFGGGTFMQANVTVDSGKVLVTEKMVVTENNITANETYLETAFTEYKVFSINYSYTPPSPPAGKGSTIDPQISKIATDWSKTWTYTIAPSVPQKTWNLGPLSLTLRAIPSLSIQWFLGWEKTRVFGKLESFETWMKITPSITVEASVTATARYTKTWSYTFMTWSTRFSFWAGSVPIWANLKLTVKASLTVDAYGKLSITTSAKVSAWYKAGVKWEQGTGWKSIWEHGSGTSRTGPHISGSAGLTVTPSVSCRLAFLLYDVGGPFVEAIPYAPISINYYTDKANTWAIQLKFKIVTGVTLAGWLQKILKLSGYSKTVADWTLISWSGNWP